MRALVICLLVISSGCVKRVVNVPKEFGTPPAGTPENAVAVNFDSDRDGRQWQILAGNEAPCLTPCSLWVDPTQTVHFRSSEGEHMYLDDLDYQLQGAKHGVVVAEGASSGLNDKSLGAIRATLDATAKSFTAPLSGEQRFYRVEDATARTLKSVSTSGNTVTIVFE